MDKIDQNITSKYAWTKRKPACDNLSTIPCPDIGKILVTGASGYIGGRLIGELLQRGYDTRIMVRAPSPEYGELWPEADLSIADALQKDQLRAAFKGVSVAYYLIHSLLLGPRSFVEADIIAARNFREAAEEAGVKRIIYLGGLGQDSAIRSDHLKSRIAVTAELARGAVPITSLRAAIIIGSGSASYEILKNLVRRLPVIPIHTWAENKCQPISIRDVLRYLVGVLEVPETTGKTYDIGGQDILSYREMMEIFAGIMGRKVRFFPLPFTDTRLYAYFAGQLTPVPPPITQCLMEGIRDEVICKDATIRQLIPFKPLTFQESILRALTREEEDKVLTRWSDSYPPAHRLARKLHEMDGPPKYTTNYSIFTDKPASALFDMICRIGGRDGWFHNNWMWRARGMLDRIFLGVGTARGRKSYSNLKVNDVIDFWRIEDVRENERLLLRAEMILPGKAWLEFTIDTQNGRRRLSVKPYFYVNSVLGALYWYNFLPFHHIIFKGLLEQIEKRA
jgi:uncharacterized protein YbjT (DUF2867 family)